MGAFDDLVPAQGAGASREPLRVTVRPQRSGMFDDLVPQGPSRPLNNMERMVAGLPVQGEREGSGALEAFRDTAPAIGQGVTLGFADEILSGMLTPFEMARGVVRGIDDGKGIGERVSDSYSRALEFNRGLDKQAQERSPIASVVGEVAGGAVTGGGLAKGGVTLLNAAKPTYRSMIGRGATEGAAYGAVHGFGSGEGMEDRLNRAKTGATIGAVTGGSMGALGARQASKAASKTAPTFDDLKIAKDAAYKEAKDAGVIINPTSYKNMVDDIYQKLIDGGVDPGLHPGVMRAFERLRELEAQPVAFDTLDILRRVANSAGKSIQNRDEGRLAGLIVDKIDDLMNNLRPSDTLVGNGAQAGKAIVKGRELYSRMRKSEALEDIMERVENKVGANYTSAGYQTAIRQEVKALLQNKKAIRGFSKQEQNLMKSIVRGASPENFLRLVGKLAIRGPISGGVALGASAVASPMAAVGMAATGEAARRVSTAITAKKMQTLIEAVRRGGPRVLQRLPTEQRQAVEAAIAAMAPAQEALTYPQPMSVATP